jgi:hypothetical protein
LTEENGVVLGEHMIEIGWVVIRREAYSIRQRVLPTPGRPYSVAFPVMWH